MKNTTLISLSAFFFGASQACSKVTKSQITFYGWPDNDPPSAQTAYNCGGRNFVAGGTGTYSDPLTMASAPGEYSQCEIVYVPYLKKYARLEDYCAQCGKYTVSSVSSIKPRTISSNTLFSYRQKQWQEPHRHLDWLIDQ